MTIILKILIIFLLYLTEAPVVVSVSGSGAGFPSNLEAPDTASVCLT